MSEEFDFESIKNKAIEQTEVGKPLSGKDGAFAPLLEGILNAALEGEMDAHLSDDERMSGNRRNGRMRKQEQHTWDKRLDGRELERGRVSAGTTSSVTDRVLPEIKAWRSQSLDPVCPTA